MGRNNWIEGITLRCRRVGDFHKSVVLLNREGGIREAMLHGGYKGKSRLSASTEPFKHLKLLLYNNPIKDSYKISDGELLGRFPGLEDEVYRIYMASSWAEILEKTKGAGAVGDEGEEIFLLFGRSLGALSAAPVKFAPGVNVQFLWRLLKIMGYEADHHNCGECGRTLDGNSVYDGREHRFLCPYCALPGADTLPGGASKYLMYSLDRPFGEAVRVELADSLLKRLEEIPMTFLKRETDIYLKTISYRRFI